jgi:hypothetical protein
VSLCLYALFTAFLPLTKAPLVVTYCNISHFSCRIWLHLFNFIQSATFNCFLQLRELEEVARRKFSGEGRVWDGRNVGFQLKFICCDSPVSWGIVMIQLSGCHFSWQIISQNVLALTECYFNVLCNLPHSQTSVRANDFSHMCLSLLSVGGGWPAWPGVVFKGSTSIF